jgi:D-glycero-alpha-D-manno-heptose 1-phosphate guanylyltransferase
VNQVIIFAGGFGIRLKDILNRMPKPMANINGRPFIEILLVKLLRLGFSDFIFSLHYKSEILIKYLNSEKNGIIKNVNVRFLVEPTALGTGGAISYIIKNIHLENHFIVINRRLHN